MEGINVSHYNVLSIELALRKSTLLERIDLTLGLTVIINYDIMSKSTVNELRLIATIKLNFKLR